MIRFDIWFPYELANFPPDWDGFACVLATALVNGTAWALWASPIVAMIVRYMPTSKARPTARPTASTGPG